MSRPSPRARILVLATVLEGGLLVVAIVLGALLDVAPFGRQGVAPIHACAIGVAGTLPLIAILVFSMRSRWRSLVEIRELLIEGFMPLFRGSGPLELLLVSALAGVGEEALFRGVMQAVLGDWLGVSSALVLTSLAFGLAHAVTRAYVVLAAVMGLYLGALFEWGGGIVVCSVAHGLYDFVALLYLQRFTSPASSRPAPGDRTPG